ncbi:MAG: hypothetical protein RLZZ383_3004 [Pseudomonadota bacterium]
MGRLTPPRPLRGLLSDGRDGLRRDGVLGVFCDIDDTLTWEGRLVPEAFAALDALQRAGLRVVPVTGRPAGWADPIARQWPVDGVVAENGGLWSYFRDGRLVTEYLQDVDTRRAHRARLDDLATVILDAVPGAALASDQAYRALDLAIDFCEDVPALLPDQVDRIVALFEAAGATAKVSSIHVNGWFGSFDKRTGCQRLAQTLWDIDPFEAPERWLFVGDSANDAPMFAAFPNAVGVANVSAFLDRMDAWPAFRTDAPGGYGFAELVAHLLDQPTAPPP